MPTGNSRLKTDTLFDRFGTPEMRALKRKLKRKATKQRRKRQAVSARKLEKLVRAHPALFSRLWDCLSKPLVGQDVVA